MFTKKVFLFLIILLINNILVAQNQNIWGVINVSQKVIHYSFCRNSVTVPSSTNFNINDKVLLIQMRGAIIDTTNTPSSGSIINTNVAGNYEFAFITSIIGNEIFLKDSVIRNYVDSGSIQIVKVPRYVNATVTDTLKCLTWDGNSGGILVFEVSGTLTLNAPIDIRDKGFRGGQEFDCSGDCWTVPAEYVRGSQNIRVKGEGIASLPNFLWGGRGTVANGGGAAGSVEVPTGHTDAWYLGGGGGGNYGGGGIGGKSSTFCAQQFSGGLGGRSLTYSTALNKIFMAGGGGVGHHRYPTTGPEFGTNGGGILIIKANTIICNNQTILAYALDVPYLYNNVGRSGGGAGGTVVLEVQNYTTGNLNINVKGGKGGDNVGSSYVGPGGGGSGGIVWVNQATFPSNLVVTLTGGLNGMQTTKNDAWGATAGQSGGTLTGLSLLQSNNHVFVPVSQATTITTNSPICVGDTLHLHSGPVPPSILYSWTGPNGFSSGLQNPSINNVTASNAGTYNLEIIVQGCPGPTTHSNVFIGVHPPPPVTSSDTVCNGNPNPGLIAHGNHVKWYADSTLSTLLVQDSIYFSAIHTPGIYTYYATQSDSVCQSIPAEVSLTILPSPTPPSVNGNDQVICFGNPANPFIAIGSGIIKWYSDSLLQHLIFTGHTYNSTATIPGIYHYYATLYDTVHLCTSPKKVVTLTIIPHAYAIASNDTSICKNGVATLSVVGPPNSTFLWSNGYTTQQISVTPITQTKYYVTVDNGCGTAKDSVTVSISPLPPTASNNTTCFGFPNPGLTAIGNSIKWYADSTLNILLSTGSTYFPTVSNVGTYTFWATQTNGICESYPKKVIFKIKPIPASPSINSFTVCYGTPNNPFVATGSGIIKWYSDSLLINLIHTGNTYLSSESNAGIYHYWAIVFDTVQSCPSLKKAITLTITPHAYAIASNDTSICKNGVATLSVIAPPNSTFLWSNGYTTQQISVTPITQTKYYVTVDNGCGTAKDSVTVSISPLPPTATNDTVCYGFPNPGLVAIGNSIKWYADSTLNILLSTGSIYVPTVSNAGTYIFWVTQSNSICESYPKKVILKIKPAPAPPSISNVTVCYGNPNSPFIATGSGIIKWYSDSLLNNLIHTGNTYLSSESNSGIYHYWAIVFDTVQSCPSLKKGVTLAIVPPVFATASNDTTICKDGVASLFVDATFNSTFLWSNGYTTQQINVTPTHQTTYYVTVDNGCGIATDSVKVSISPLPPITTNDTVCSGLPNPGLIAIGNSIKWYADSTLNILLFSGSIYFPTVSNAGTHIFWATQTVNACESYPEKGILVILQSPAPPVINNLIVCYDTPNSPFIATGTGTISWYSDSLLTNLIHTGNTYTSTEVNVGVYHYYVTVFDPVVSCTSQKKDVTLTILPPAFAIACHDTTVCAGEPVNLFVDASLYSSFLWSTGDTTQQISVNPTILTHFYVTVDNGCGAPATDSVTVFVNPLPNAYAGKDTTICIGQNATLVASGGISYLWNHNAGNTSTVVVSPTVPTNYIVTVTDINGCKNTDDVNVNISNFPVAHITGDSLICEGNQAILTASGGFHYLWSIGDTTANISVSPSNTAVYYVTVSNSSNCKDSSSFEVTVHNTFHVSMATAEFGADNPISITQGQLITFMVLPPNNYSLFNFYINDALQQSSISNTFISASLGNNNIVSVIAFDSFGSIDCPSTEDSIMVIVKGLPNAFIPFGSDPENMLFAKGLYLTILNRWGQEIFKGTEGWNGEYKNQKVSPGTYYYIIELNKGTSFSKMLTGSVNVVVK